MKPSEKRFETLKMEWESRREKGLKIEPLRRLVTTVVTKIFFRHYNILIIIEILTGIRVRDAGVGGSNPLVPTNKINMLLGP